MPKYPKEIGKLHLGDGNHLEADLELGELKDRMPISGENTEEPLK